MSGLVLLGVIGIWILIVIAMAIWLGNRLRSRGLRFDVVFVVTAVVLLPLPIADELITAPQFNKLCEEGTRLRFDPAKIRGKTIFLAEGPSPQPHFSVGLLPGYFIPSRYLDANTKEELITFNSYFLNGGFLMRAARIPEMNTPLTMRSYCAPKEEPWQRDFLNRYELKRAERKDVK